MFDHNPALKRIWELASFKNPTRTIVDSCAPPVKISEGRYRFDLCVNRVVCESVEVPATTSEAAKMVDEIQGRFRDEQHSKSAPPQHGSGSWES